MMPGALVSQIQELWESGNSPPDFFQILESHADASIADTVEAILVDQRHRWKTARPVSVEAYVERVLSLAANRDVVLKLAVGEFQARRQFDASLDFDQFSVRFANLGPAFREDLEALVSSSMPQGGASHSTQEWRREESRDTARVDAKIVRTELSGNLLPEGLTPADRIGRYRRVRLLGEGAFGQVWLGVDEELRRQVAIKVPTPKRFRTPEDATAYLTEARTLATLDHPHIVPVYDVGRTAQGAVYVVSKFVAGQDLADRIKQNRPVPLEAVRIVATVAEALHHAHEKHLIHRDVKPANILIEERTQRPYLADFGLAISEEDYLREGRIAGTPAYMSPEQAGAEGGRFDGRSDLFSLGVVLYELLTGQKPFQGSTLDEVVRQVLFQPAAPLRELDDTMAPELDRICLKALAKRADERYATGADMAADLRRWRQEVEPRQDETASIRHNLPASRDVLIGRAREVEELRGRLLDSRLITLTGAGGSGKTRLVLEVAEQSLNDFAGGVFLVELASLREPTLVPAAVAQAVGCNVSGERSVVEILIEWFGRRRVLLLLDNFEHLTSAAGVVSELLAGCSGLHVLVTSRTALHLSGEQEYPLSLLELPRENQVCDANECSRYSAISLFVQRARETLPSFQLDDQNAASVARICARLDGLPLAIELAAARIKVLSPEAILLRLQSRLKLLVSGRRDAPERQQNLRATIAWSYDLLRPEEKVLFRRLAVFGGGCTLEAAEALGLFDGGNWDVLDVLASLVDKSLIRHTETARGRTRFSMLETVREFALDCLGRSGEQGEVRHRHAKWFVALAEELEPRFNGQGSKECMDRLAEEYGNLRAVLEWSIAPQDGAPSNDADRGQLGLRLGGALWRFWSTRGLLREADYWMSELLRDADAGRRGAVGAKARYAAGCVAEDLGEYAKARAYYVESRTLWEAMGDRQGLAASLIALGSISNSQGDFASAEQCFQQALESYREVGDRRGVAVALSNLGSCAWSLGDFEGAKARHAEALLIRRERKDDGGIAVTLTSLGLVAMRTGELAKAHMLYGESLEILRRLQNVPGIAVSLNNLAEAACQQGEYSEALRLLAEAIAIQHDIGDRLSLAYSLESLATCAHRQGDLSSAVQHFATAEALRALMGSPLPPLERAIRDEELNVLRIALGSSCFDAEWATGHNTPLDEAVTGILQKIASPSVGFKDS